MRPATITIVPAQHGGEPAVRLMLAGLLTGIVHDRKLIREAQVNIAIRWFAGMACPSVSDKDGPAPVGAPALSVYLAGVLFELCARQVNSARPPKEIDCVRSSYLFETAVIS